MWPQSAHQLCLFHETWPLLRAAMAINPEARAALPTPPRRPNRAGALLRRVDLQAPIPDDRDARIALVRCLRAEGAGSARSPAERPQPEHHPRVTARDGPARGGARGAACNDVTAAHGARAATGRLGELGPSAVLPAAAQVPPVVGGGPPATPLGGGPCGGHRAARVARRGVASHRPPQGPGLVRDLARRRRATPVGPEGA